MEHNEVVTFIADVTVHNPPKHKQYIRRYAFIPPVAEENGWEKSIYTDLLQPVKKNMKSIQNLKTKWLSMRKKKAKWE